MSAPSTNTPPQKAAAQDPAPAPASGAAPRSARWRKAAGLAAATVVLFTGLEGLSSPSWKTTLVSLPVAAAGLFWLLKQHFVGAAEQTDSYRRRRRRFYFLAINIAAPLLVVLVAAAVRMGPTKALLRGRVYRASLVDQAAEEELGWAPVAPAVVVGQRLQAVDPARKHVLFIGDSILYGQGVADGETAIHLVENRIPGRQLLNAAVSGYSPDQYYLYLRRIIGAVRPELVVVGVFTGNDIQVNAKEYAWGHSKPLFDIENGELVRVNRSGPCIDHLAQSLLFRAAWANHGVAGALIDALCKPRVLNWGRNEEVMGRLFDAMARVSREHGAQTLFMLLPWEGDQLFRDRRQQMPDRYQTLHRLLASRGHAIYEPISAFARARQAGVQDIFQSDNAHLTATGHRVLADALLQMLELRYGLAAAPAAAAPAAAAPAAAAPAAAAPAAAAPAAAAP